MRLTRKLSNDSDLMKAKVKKEQDKVVMGVYKNPFVLVPPRDDLQEIYSTRQGPRLSNHIFRHGSSPKGCESCHAGAKEEEGREVPRATRQPPGRT